MKLQIDAYQSKYLGLFEREIVEIAKLVHDCGGLVYYDGANANAILGKVRPGDMGFDVVHFNLHKPSPHPMVAEDQVVDQ